MNNIIWFPITDSLHKKIRERGEFDLWSITTTRSIIMSMGFKFQRAHAQNHAALIESPYILEVRKHYLYKIFMYKQAGRIMIYFDESFVNANHCPDRILVDTTVVSAKDAEERDLTTGNLANNGFFSLFSLQDK